MDQTVEDQTVEDRAAEASASGNAPYLFLALEADAPRARGGRYLLADARSVALRRGSQRSFDLADHSAATLAIPDAVLSSRHAQLARSGSRWVIEDLGSRNGTRVNGEAVREAALSDGDVIQVGHTFLIFRAALPVSPGSPPIFHGAELAKDPPGIRTLLPALQERHASLRRMAGSRLPILILGATGTGKELVARAIHNESGRGGPFVPVNCAALPATLVESLLFGHAKGAFSGATRDEPGFVRAAQGGTLFLDEIGDLAPPGQATLLRVLQEREVIPVGSTKSVAVDFRLVAATHQPLARLVEEGKFRADLHARLRAFTHTLPPLSERREDLGVIIADILDGFIDGPRDVRFSPTVARTLLSYEWPLNIRELQQGLAAAVVLSSDGTIEDHLVPEWVSAPRATRGGTKRPLAPGDQELAAALTRQLEEHNGNVSAVARAMRKEPTQIRRWLTRFGIPPDTYRR